MGFPSNLSKHRQAVFEILAETGRDPSRRSVLKIRGTSMTPLVRMDDEVSLGAVPETGLSQGDLLAYRHGDLLFVHRVAAEVSVAGERQLYEKGDNNFYLTPVASQRVLGLVHELFAGGRRIDLRRPAWRRLGRAAAAYGLYQVRLYQFLQRAGGLLLAPGSRPSRWADARVRGVLKLPLGLTLALARRWL